MTKFGTNYVRTSIWRIHSYWSILTPFDITFHPNAHLYNRHVSFIHWVVLKKVNIHHKNTYNSLNIQNKNTYNSVKPILPMLLKFFINWYRNVPIIHNRFHAYWCPGDARNCSISNHYIDALVQERRNSIASALELRLSCINPSIFILFTQNTFPWMGWVNN